MTERPESSLTGAGKHLGLVTLLAGILVALLGLLAPPASAAPIIHPQTRVAAIAEPASQLVGPHATVLAGEGRQRTPNYDSSATGSSVAAEDETGTALAQRLGSEGESVIPGTGNTVRIPSATGTAAYRIPDILNPEEGVIGEVKNVASLSYTSQLRDFAAYAEENGSQFDLYVRSTTQLSGPLQQAIAEGTIDLRYLP